MTQPIANIVNTVATGGASTGALITYFSTVDPNPQNTQFPVQKRWVNTDTNTEFILYGFTSTGGYVLANWVRLTGNASVVQFLTGNSGGAVVPTGANINFLGDGTTVNIVGNPGTHTLTANVILPGTSNVVLLGQISSISGISLSSGQLVVGGTGAPAASTLTAGTGISIANGNNSITVNSVGSGFTWINQTAGPENIAPNTAYTADSASLITLKLPNPAVYGDSYKVVGKGTGLWSIVYGPGQIIHFGTMNTTISTGSLSSTSQYDTVELTCTAAPTDFTVTSFLGTLAIL